MTDLTITIKERAGGGYECRDDHTQALGVDALSMHLALLEWMSQAVKLGVFAEDALPPKPGPLRLVWPTDYRVFTQRFGERPEYYGRFGLPGHEGVDIRAPKGTPIYACFAGEVTMAGWHPRVNDHAYGVQVRLRHVAEDGEYETMYAHCQEGSIVVAVGEWVLAGQMIARADMTGNAGASHLHLSVRKIGLINNCRGMIDPQPLFIDGPVP